jgi:DNA-directed RNA polymerase specialized sigma subunit
MQELQRVFSRGVAFLLARRLPPHVAETRAKEVLGAVEQAIQRGELADPDELVAFIRRAVKMLIEDCQALRQPTLAPKQDPRKVKLMTEILRRLPERERDAIRRFYVGEQSEQEICAAVRMSREQFRRLKARVRESFGEWVAAMPEGMG